MTKTDREQLAAEHPDAWIPVSPGEMIEGVITDLDVGYTQMGDRNYPILTIAEANGVETKVFGFATALHNEIFRKQPIPGERITITYAGQGEAKVKGESGAELYRLRIHNRSPESYRRMYDLLQPRGRNFVAASLAAGIPTMGELTSGNAQT
jgi:hypothetical protein